jgi:hypothetical protein
MTPLAKLRLLNRFIGVRSRRRPRQQHDAGGGTHADAVAAPGTLAPHAVGVAIMLHASMQSSNPKERRLTAYPAHQQEQSTPYAVYEGHFLNTTAVARTN